MNTKHRLTTKAVAMLLSILYGAGAAAQELLPIEAYGTLPEISLMAISPSGKFAAMRSASAEADAVAIQDLSTGEYLTAADVTRVNPRHLSFVNDKHLMLITSGRHRSIAVRGSYERSTAFDFNIEETSIRKPLDKARNIYPHQGGLGKIVGRSADHNSIYMPAYIGERSGQPTYGYYRVDFDRRRPRQIARGSSETVDWFLRGDGSPLLREDFDNGRNLHQLWRIDDGEKTLLYEKRTAIPTRSFVGLTEDRKFVVFRASASGSDVDKYYTLNIEDGDVSGPILGRDDVDVDYVITDLNRTVIGVRYTGFLPSYHFIDEELNQRVEAIQERLSGMYVELIDWSDDYEKLLFFISGPWTAGNYLLFQGDDSKPISLGSTRPGVKREHIATVRIGEYEARDGLTIPMLVTARDGMLQEGNAPLIVIPHGGPAAHDTFGFDWQAQYFANRGYVVLQPQFRGSTGFGKYHEYAGRGEWGGKMQTDIDDGVDYLVEQGIADPDRVCIIGGSYGGYAALAAGAFTPDKYKCIVSFAGVSDLPEMLKDEARDVGGDHWVVAYWARQVGLEKGVEKLKAISPYYHADKFKAPVLLIHGRDDLVVPEDQSKRMERALKRAGKDVEYVMLKGEDHYYTNYETRLESLKLMAEFIDEHL